MLYKFSRCICLSTPDHDRAIAFYRDLIGLEVTEKREDSVEFKAGPYRLFVDRNDQHGVLTEGMVFELIVPDLEAARAELETAGCTVVRWEGKGKDCYIRDPYGAVFNLWQEPEESDT